MTAAQLGGLAGLVMAAGLVLIVRGLRAAPPSLAAALAQLDTTPTAGTPSRPLAAGAAGEWLPLPVVAILAGRLGVTDADLDITQTSRAQLAARKVSASFTGLLAPNVVTVFAHAVGLALPVVIPAGLSLVLAATLWITPSLDVKTRATRERRVFRINLEAFLILAAGEQLSNGSPEQALDQASALSGTYPFLRMRQAIRRSVHSGAPPWNELRNLSEELAIPELRNLADIAQAASTGVAVYKTYLAQAATMRVTELNDMRTQANTLSERMSRPLSLLVASLTLFVILPFLIKISSGG